MATVDSDDAQFVYSLQPSEQILCPMLKISLYIDDVFLVLAALLVLSYFFYRTIRCTSWACNQDQKIKNQNEDADAEEPD